MAGKGAPLYISVSQGARLKRARQHNLYQYTLL